MKDTIEIFGRTVFMLFMVTVLALLAEGTWGRTVALLVGVLSFSVLYLLWRICEALELISKQIFNIAIKRNKNSGRTVLYEVLHAALHGDD